MIATLAADDGGSCWNPLNWAGCTADAIAGSAFNAMVNAIGTGLINMLKFTSTFWMWIPSPTVAHGNTRTAVVYQMQSMMTPVTAFVAFISFTLAIGRIAWGYHAGAEVRGLVRQLATVAAGSLIVVVVVQTLINAGDIYSPWILQQATGKPPSEAVTTVAMATAFQGGTPGAMQGLWLFIFVLALLASIMQCLFMIVRGATLIVLMAFVPPVAAGSATEEGWTRFKRLGALMIGFALYKPVAATIYATGLMLLSTYGNGSTTADDIKNALYGVTIIILAALSLPAFIKFILPAAAAGASSAFSGAAAVGAVAAGAAIVGLTAASGGAGAAGASGGAGARGATGAATATPNGGGMGGSPGSLATPGGGDGSGGGGSPGGAAASPGAAPPSGGRGGDLVSVGNSVANGAQHAESMIPQEET